VAGGGGLASRELFQELAARLEPAPRGGAPAGPPASGGRGSAAVLAVFRCAPGGVEVLLIQRAEREGDPWSGHIGLPGGRWEPEDRDLVATALRETREEVGVEPSDLERSPLLVGIRSPANRPTMPVAVLVSVLKDGVDRPFRSSPEVDEAFWVPVSKLEPSNGPVPVRVPGGEYRAEALVYEGRVVWGFTRRVLLDMFERLEGILDRPKATRRSAHPS
jgi:8-oxo-dGTP pyrophosphatase MutT (NUDIX family)